MAFLALQQVSPEAEEELIYFPSALEWGSQGQLRDTGPAHHHKAPKYQREDLQNQQRPYDIYFPD